MSGLSSPDIWGMAADFKKVRVSLYSGGSGFWEAVLWFIHVAGVPGVLAAALLTAFLTFLVFFFFIRTGLPP